VKEKLEKKCSMLNKREN